MSARPRNTERYAAIARLLDWVDTKLAKLRDFVADVRFRSAVALLHDAEPNDVFIVSYPKAGTTVLQMLLYQMLSGGDMRFRHIDAVVPWFDAHILRGGSGTATNLGRHRVFKTHRPFSMLPSGATYIYVVREPKDSCASYYYHYRTVLGSSVFVERFADDFLNGRVTCGSWFDHFKACCTVPRSGRTLVLSYNDLCGSLPVVVDKVSTFLGVQLNTADRDRVIERCGLAFMRANNEKFDPRWAFGPPAATPFIRKGVPGDWSTLLTPYIARRIDESLSRTLEHVPADIAATRLPLIGSGQTGVRGTLRILVGANDVVRPPCFKVVCHDKSLMTDDVVRLELTIQGRGMNDPIIVDEAVVESLIDDAAGRSVVFRIKDAAALGYTAVLENNAVISRVSS